MKHLAPALLLSLSLFSCNWYGAGSGYGILVISDSTADKYKTSYLERYADTLLKKYPRYMIPESINRPILMQYPQENRTDTIYEYPGAINDICFFLPDPPREIYFIQWQGGTGFWIREVRDVDRMLTYVEYSGRPPEPDTLKKRIEKRFMKEIYSRIDSLIVASPEYDSALYEPSY
jgi:hypothetical protein